LNEREPAAPAVNEEEDDAGWINDTKTVPRNNWIKVVEAVEDAVKAVNAVKPSASTFYSSNNNDDVNDAKNAADITLKLIKVDKNIKIIQGDNINLNINFITDVYSKTYYMLLYINNVAERFKNTPVMQTAMQKVNNAVNAMSALLYGTTTDTDTQHNLTNSGKLETFLRNEVAVKKPTYISYQFRIDDLHKSCEKYKYIYNIDENIFYNLDMGEFSIGAINYGEKIYQFYNKNTETLTKEINQTNFGRMGTDKLYDLLCNFVNTTDVNEFEEQLNSFKVKVIAHFNPQAISGGTSQASSPHKRKVRSIKKHKFPKKKSIKSRSIEKSGERP